MKLAPFDNMNRSCWRLAALGTLLLTGCHAAPPRYMGTWHSVTSRRYVPTIPCCHGFVPTKWSHWPAECEACSETMFEELTVPVGTPADSLVVPPREPLPASYPDRDDPNDHDAASDEPPLGKAEMPRRTKERHRAEVHREAKPSQRSTMRFKAIDT